MECKGRGTMKCCVFLWGAHLRLLFLSLSVGTFLISLPRRSFSRHYSRPEEFSGGGGVVMVVELQVKPSHKNGQTKNKYATTPPPPDKKKTTNESNTRLGDAWGQLLQMKVEMNHGAAVWGPRRMVRQALSRTRYRHAVNHSPHFFPVQPAVGRKNHKSSTVVAFVTWVEIFHVRWCVSFRFYGPSTLWDLSGSEFVRLSVFCLASPHQHLSSVKIWSSATFPSGFLLRFPSVACGALVLPAHDNYRC